MHMYHFRVQITYHVLLLLIIMLEWLSCGSFILDHSQWDDLEWCELSLRVGQYTHLVFIVRKTACLRNESLIVCAKKCSKYYGVLRI